MQPDREGQHDRRRVERQAPPVVTPAVHPPAVQPEEGAAESAWRIVRRRWAVLLESIVLLTALAIGLSLSQPDQYTASVSLLFNPASEGVLDLTAYSDPARQAATNESLLGLPAVAAATSERLNGRMSPQAIENAAEVVSDRQGDLMSVEVTTGDPQLSADVANAYGDAFVEFRLSSARDQLQGAIESARESLAAMTATERDGEEGQALRDRINQLETAQALQTGGADVVQRATVPTERSSPQPVRNGILGFLLGAVLGFAVAALLERSDRAIKSVEELERVSGWPVLARIPNSRSLGRGRDLSPRSAEAEAFRMLRASLRYFSVNTEIRSLLITSARSGEGKSTTARRLAEAMASMGDRIVLVEADMHRKAKMEAELGPGERGLSGYLIGADINDVLLEVPVGHPDEGRTLAILPSGPLPPNPTELLESTRMHELMEQLEDHFDMVIVDSPPLPVISDAMTLIEHVSGIIVVMAIGTTTSEDVRDVARLITLHSGAVLGIVANFAPGVDRVKGYYDGRDTAPEADAADHPGAVPARREVRSGSRGRS